MGADQRATEGLPEDPDALEKIIEARRRHLAETVDQLVVQAHPKAIARRTVTDARAGRGLISDAPAPALRTDRRSAAALVLLVVLVSSGGGRGRGVACGSDAAGEPAGNAAAACPPEHDRLPIRMLHDRVLVSDRRRGGERRSTSGIVIPATAAVGKRLAWAGWWRSASTCGQVQVGDRVLYDPEDRAEVELQGAQYVLLRERDIHAVAAPRVEDGQTGLYL